MRILVHNYSSETSTEPAYFAQYLQSQGHQVHMWKNERSAFDMFDDFNPDLYITHFVMLSEDIIKRIYDSDIQVCINVTGISKNVLDLIKSRLPKAYLFQNFNMVEVDVIPPCCDTYIGESTVDRPVYSIETLFIVDTESDMDLISGMFDSKDTYHVIATSSDLNKIKEVDACVPVAGLPMIYQNYSEVIVTKPNQAFFDAAYYNGSCGLVQREGNPLFLQKKVVESLHSPYNRITELLEKIGKNDG